MVKTDTHRSPVVVELALQLSSTGPFNGLVDVSSR